MSEKSVTIAVHSYSTECSPALASEINKMGEDIMDTILSKTTKRYPDDLMDDDYLEETVYRRKLHFSELDYNCPQKIAVESNPEEDSPILKWM